MDSKDSYRYLFGPVPSRRLGISLGVDLVPGRICSLDCVYCECGKTHVKTCDRSEYVPTKAVWDELVRMLSRKPLIDHITFSGSGEPTLHTGIGDIIRSLKKKFPEYPVAVLSNGTLVDRNEVREELLAADVLKVSLDAASDAVFRRINRPAPGIDLQRMLDALVATRREFRGLYWVEVFIIPGLNDTREELGRIRQILRLIAPDMVQINAMDRPGTEPWVQGVSKERMRFLAEHLEASNVLRHSAQPPGRQGDSFDFEHRIIDAVRRRPYTCRDMAMILGTTEHSVQRQLNDLVSAGVLKTMSMPRGLFYVPTDR